MGRREVLTTRRGERRRGEGEELTGGRRGGEEGAGRGRAGVKCGRMRRAADGMWKCAGIRWLRGTDGVFLFFYAMFFSSSFGHILFILVLFLDRS